MQGCQGIITVRRPVRPLALFLCLLPCAGCVLFENDIAKKAPVGPVYRVETYWKQEIVQVNQGGAGNGMTLPGLAGRVYLFGPEIKHPLAARGESMIAVEMSYVRPDGKPQTVEWKFPKKHLDPLLSRDIVGWGYTVPLPWVEYHPNIRKVTIKVAYIPEKGAPIVGSPQEFSIQQAGVKVTRQTLPPGAAQNVAAAK